jgi:hypothetical protein
MKRSERVPVVRCGCFGDVEEHRAECFSIPQEDQQPPEELDVSSFAGRLEDQDFVDLEKSRKRSFLGSATHFNAFISAVASRLQAGEGEYQNRSFARPPAELAGEIEEELEDVAGWAFILWCRIARLREIMGEDGLRQRDEKLNSGNGTTVERD